MPGQEHGPHAQQQQRQGEGGGKTQVPAQAGQVPGLACLGRVRGLSLLGRLVAGLADGLGDALAAHRIRQVLDRRRLGSEVHRRPSTPGRALMARSTRATQEAQVMPPTPMVTDPNTGS